MSLKEDGVGLGAFQARELFVDPNTVDELALPVARWWIGDCPPAVLAQLENAGRSRPSMDLRNRKTQ